MVLTSLQELKACTYIYRSPRAALSTDTIEAPGFLQPGPPLCRGQARLLAIEVGYLQLPARRDVAAGFEQPSPANPAPADVGRTAVVEIAGRGPHAVPEELRPFVLEGADAEAVVDLVRLGCAQGLGRDEAQQFLGQDGCQLEVGADVVVELLGGRVRAAVFLERQNRAPQVWRFVPCEDGMGLKDQYVDAWNQIICLLNRFLEIPGESLASGPGPGGGYACGYLLGQPPGLVDGCRCWPAVMTIYDVFGGVSSRPGLGQLLDGCPCLHAQVVVAHPQPCLAFLGTECEAVTKVSKGEPFATVVGETLPADLASVLSEQDMGCQVVGGVDGGATGDILSCEDSSPCAGSLLDFKKSRVWVLQGSCHRRRRQ